MFVVSFVHMLEHLAFNNEHVWADLYECENVRWLSWLTTNDFEWAHACLIVCLTIWEFCSCVCINHFTYVLLLLWLLFVLCVCLWCAYDAQFARLWYFWRFTRAHLICFWSCFVKGWVRGLLSFLDFCIMQNNMEYWSCFCEEKTHVWPNIPACVQHLLFVSRSWWMLLWT